MTPGRFAALADAYGGNIGRWPAAERDDARAHLHGHPEAQAALDTAAALDASLAAWTVGGPGPALAARIASAVAHRHAYGRRLRLWFSSLGTAAALAGGVAAGAAVIAVSAPAADQAAEPLYGLSVLGAPLDLTQQPAADGRP